MSSLEDGPPTGASFLERYRQARTPASPSSSPTVTSAAPASPSSSSPPSPNLSKPAAPPSPRKTGAAHVWGSVFHPLGRSPTSASRYDSAREAEGTGGSVSEMHDEGRWSVIEIGRIED